MSSSANVKRTYSSLGRTDFSARVQTAVRCECFVIPEKLTLEFCL